MQIAWVRKACVQITKQVQDKRCHYDSSSGKYWCCWFGCHDRRRCYEEVSRKNLGEEESDFQCKSPDAKEGYRFSKAMKNPGFIGIGDIKNKYLPMGFSNFKIEGRGLGSALILEFLLYYMTKPEYHLSVRENIYLDNMLDLF